MSQTSDLMIHLMSNIYTLHREAGDLLNDATDFLHVIDGREGNAGMRSAIQIGIDRTEQTIGNLKDRRKDIAKLKAGLATRLEIE